MILLVLLWAIGANWLAYKKGFYRFRKETSKTTVVISTKQLLLAFGIYLFLALLATPLLARLFLGFVKKVNPDATSIPIIALTAIQLFSMIAIFFLLQWFIYSQDTKLFRGIWSPKKQIPNHPTEFDFGIGAASWLLAFPVASVVAEFVDRIIQSVFGLSHYEQTAVQFVKAAAGAPFALIFAFFAVIIMAPLIEEFLFRGILQTYLKKRVGAISAILLSAFTFSLFHFSPGQGMGNISLITALFILGCFLGFLYERQKSLWASIGLHMTFNAISALRIIIFPEA